MPKEKKKSRANECTIFVRGALQRSKAKLMGTDLKAWLAQCAEALGLARPGWQVVERSGTDEPKAKGK